jgi:hypothetical protein
MTYKTVTATAAILSFFNGVLFLLAPVFSLSLLGRDTNLTGIMNTRNFGACALGLAVIAWLAKDVQYPEVRRLVSYGMLITLGDIGRDRSQRINKRCDEPAWLVIVRCRPHPFPWIRPINFYRWGSKKITPHIWGVFAAIIIHLTNL